jgi:urease accessory protein
VQLSQARLLIIPATGKAIGRLPYPSCSGILGAPGFANHAVEPACPLASRLPRCFRQPINGGRINMADEALRIEGIVGHVDDASLHDALHRLDHAGRLEQVTLGADDMLRRRLRVRTDRGTECAIALAREEKLFDGAVLFLDRDRAVTVRAAEASWLSVQPADMAAAIELGYCSGNMHWRVAFAGPVLRIALNGPKSDYLARLAPLFDAGRIKEVGDG